LSRSKIYARLTEPEIDALIRLGQLERRAPSEQAGLLIAEGLRARGALANATSATPTDHCGEDEARTGETADRKGNGPIRPPSDAENGSRPRRRMPSETEHVW
jgi:hypothetical protein